MTGACFTWLYPVLLFDSHVSFGSDFHKRFCGWCWRMTLVNNPLAVVGWVSANTIKDTTWKVTEVSLPFRELPQPYCGRSSGQELVCVCWLLLGFSVIVWNSDCIKFPLLLLHILGFHSSPAFAGVFFDRISFHLPHFYFRVSLPEQLTSLDSQLTDFIQAVAAAFCF